ncbi:MAG: class II aldolase/adducin family protein [Elusimicrobiota bacterium]
MQAQGLRELIRLCRHLGKDPLLVQAGGGNVSVKIGGGLLIKASGLRLDEVGPRRGWARADLQTLRKGLAGVGRLRTPLSRDRAYARLLTRAGRTPGRRISMEAGFHAALEDRCVAHVHSAAGILLGMLPERRIRRLLGPGTGYRSVGADIPGADLTLSMAGTRTPARAHARAYGAGLWILRNHGLVWEGESGPAILRAAGRLEKRLRRAFRLGRYPIPKPIRVLSDRYALRFHDWPDCRFDFRPLFPDFTVYFRTWDGSPGPFLEKVSSREVLIRASGEEDLRAKVETFYVHALISTASRPPRRLPRAAGRAIAGLESERLRLKQGGRK